MLQRRFESSLSRRGLFVRAGIVSALMLAGCIRKEPAAPKPDASYTTRGKIITLPKTGSPPEYLEIHHEKIPSFRNSAGKQIGMDEMVMPFPELGPGLKLESLKVGDKVKLTFEVYWKPRARYVATAVSKLPDDTALEITAESAKP